MSSYISIGFVFVKHQNITVLFSEFLNCLITNGNFQKISYSVDKNGDRWHEEIIKARSTDEITSLMANNFFGKININAMILGDRDIDFDISISKFSQGDFGFLIEIDIDQLFEVGNKKELEGCSSMIIKFCKRIYYKIQYQYAFCDHEVGIEYTWSEFNKLNDSIYSISIIPRNEEFVVNLATWEIDGLTNRIIKNV